MRVRLQKLDGWDSFDQLLLCPVCGFDYTHIAEVFTRKGHDKFEAGIYGGTKQKGHSGLRRSALVIVAYCESGHLFEVVIQQHKGQNFIKANLLEEEHDFWDEHR